MSTWKQLLERVFDMKEPATKFGSAKPRVRPTKRRYLLSIELLEDRLTPAVYTVTGNGDAGAGVGNSGDLRYVITQLNAMGGAANTISFAQGVAGQIGLASALPAINSNVEINGPGQSVLEIRRTSANDPYRIFAVNAGITVTITGLTMSNGKVLTGGGGIRNMGTLTVVDCTLADNIGSTGGAIYSGGGSLTVTGCTIRNNTGPGGGGGISFESQAQGTATIHNSRIMDNTADLVLQR